MGFIQKGLQIIMIIIFLTSFVLADFGYSSVGQQSLGTFRQGDCITLLQICANCSFINISSIWNPSSTQVSQEVSMIKSQTDYSYLFCNTSLSGVYNINGVGDENGKLSIWTYSFTITPSGRTFSLGDIIIYSFFLLICLVLLYFSAKLVISNPSSKDPLLNSKLYQIHRVSEVQYYLEVLKGKLWTVGVFGIYLSILIFTSFLNQMVYNLGLEELNVILKYVTILLSWGLIPFCLFWLGYIIITVYKTTENVLRYQFGGFKQ
jgi:hypothetical protein